MTARFTSSCLFVVSVVFVACRCLCAEESFSLFQCYLATCKNTDNQPVHLRNTSQEKDPLFTEMTILDLAVPPLMQSEEVVERVLYADVDVVCLNDTSTERASFLYELLQDKYSHFIHMPDKEMGIFIASKYPLSQPMATLIEEENASVQKVLEFSIHGANTYCASVCSSDALQMARLDDYEESAKTPILLFDMPATLTVIKQQFFPLKLAQKANPVAPDTFQMIPIRHYGEGDDNKAGCKGEVTAGCSWGGKEGVHFEIGARMEAHDNQGNYVAVEVTQHDNGEGSANAHAGHEEK